MSDPMGNQHTSDNNDFEDIKLEVAGGFGAGSANKQSEDDVTGAEIADGGDPSRMTSGRSSTARKNSV